MRNFANQNSPAKGPESQDWLDDSDVEISDLHPTTRSHYLLLNLKNLRRRLKTDTQQLIQHITSSADNSQENNGETTDDFELEISDLPPRKRSHHILLRLIALKESASSVLPGKSRKSAQTTSRTRRARIGQALTAFSLCVALLVLLLGNSPGLRTQLFGSFLQPTATVSPGSYWTNFSSRSNTNSRVIVRGSSRIDFSVTNSRETPGVLPDTCPQTTSLERFLTPLDPPGVGGGPLWVTGLAGPTAALIDLQPVPLTMDQPPRTFFSWYTTITLFVQKGFTKPILLTGGDQVTARPLAFGDPGAQSLSNRSYQLYLNSIDSDDSDKYTSSGQWEVRALNVFVRGAGCYFLQAGWDGGMWLAYLAIGTHY